MRWMMLLCGLLLAPSTARGDHGPAPLMVAPGIVCPLEAVLADAERAKETLRFQANSACRRFPGHAPVVRVVAGPFKDAEGDTFFIVQVDQAGNWFTIAWPGINTNLHKTTFGGSI